MRRLLFLATIGDGVGQIGIGSLLGFIGNEAGNLGGRFAGEIGAMSGGALCFFAKQPPPEETRYQEILKRLDALASDIAGLRSANTSSLDGITE